MSENVGTVLLAVPVYRVEGHDSCEFLPRACPFYADDDGGNHCSEVMGRLTRTRAESGHWYTPCLSTCPLRQPGVLTPAALRKALQGRPEFDWIDHHEFGECRGCGARIYDGKSENHAPDCPTVLAQREHDATDAALKAIEGEEG